MWNSFDCACADISLMRKDHDMIKETHSEKDTFALGQKLGAQASPGDVFTLEGDLGVGKTIFTKGFARGLGIEEPVSSPTFTIPGG